MELFDKNFFHFMELYDKKFSLKFFCVLLIFMFRPEHEHQTFSQMKKPTS